VGTPLSKFSADTDLFLRAFEKAFKQ